MIYLHICINCLPTDKRGAPDKAACQKLSDALLANNIKAQIITADCLGVCDAPASLSMRAHKRATYVFSDIDILADQQDIIATCKAYLAAEKGWIEDARPCGRLRHCLKARLPALPDDHSAI